MYLEMERVLFRPRLIRLISPHIFMGDWKQNIEILVLFFFLHFYLSQLSLPKKIEILIHFFFHYSECQRRNTVILSTREGEGDGGGGVLIWGGMTRFPLYARFNVYHFSWK